MEYKPMEGKRALITGASGGIGRATALAFARRGAEVWLADIDREGGEEVAAMIAMEGGSAHFLYGDITEEAVLREIHKQVTAGGQGLDYLINNACISRKGILSGCSFEDFNYVLRLGVTAPYMLARLFMGDFRPDAAIVNISSSRHLMSQEDTESYTAAKGGIAALTHALSVSLRGIARVNSVSPGWIETGGWHHGEEGFAPEYTEGDRAQHSVGRVGVPEDIVGAILFLCSPGAGFVTGQDLVVDGGMTKQMIYHNDLGWSYDPVEGRKHREGLERRARKAALRKVIRKQRRALDPVQRKVWDASIEAQVLAMEEYRKAKTVFCFVSYGGEPETRGILRDILEKGKTLAVPRCMEDGIMEAVLLTDLGQLEKGMYGIEEPAAGLPTLPFEEIDFAVVPALAFTADGERLGQGGGYYDRFMARTNAFTCGICYRDFVLDSVPTEEFDRKVDAVVCEKCNNA